MCTAVPGIIPAGAGHFPPIYRTHHFPRDHPRRCGALMATNGELDFEKGSSPQVRGTWQAIRYLFRATGIIPAGAGHFVYVANVHGCPWDHPRRCGALSGSGDASRISGGSSPQVRGTCGGAYRDGHPRGIIPAGAGHFAIPTHQPARPGDHPRRCGALFISRCYSVICYGSSPQVRGTSGEGKPLGG